MGRAAGAAASWATVPWEHCVCGCEQRCMGCPSKDSSEYLTSPSFAPLPLSPYRYGFVEVDSEAIASLVIKKLQVRGSASRLFVLGSARERRMQMPVANGPMRRQVISARWRMHEGACDVLEGANGLRTVLCSILH